MWCNNWFRKCEGRAMTAAGIVPTALPEANFAKLTHLFFPCLQYWRCRGVGFSKTSKTAVEYDLILPVMRMHAKFWITPNTPILRWQVKCSNAPNTFFS